MTNFPPGIVTGTIHVNDVTAQAGEAALAVAYNNAAGRVGAFIPAVGNVGGLTFTPGLYRSGTSTAISGGGNLALDTGRRSECGLYLPDRFDPHHVIRLRGYANRRS